MFHRWAAPVLVLALCAMSPKNAAGQTVTQSREHGAGKLGRNYPNPFNPDTKIDFSVFCSAGTTEEHVVTVQVVNILGQVTAIPTVFGPSLTSISSASTAFNGRLLSNLKLPCGDYVGLWNGKLGTTEKEAASGPYIVQFYVDGKLMGTRRIFYRK